MRLKTIILKLLIFTGTLAKSQDIDVLHYKFIVALNDADDTLQGNSTIRFVKRTASSTIEFDLTSVNAGGKGMQVADVDIDLRPYHKTKFAQLKDKLLINSTEIKQGDTATVKILYKGIPDDGLIISKNKYGDRTFFADNWPNRAHHWLPCADRPDDKASFEFMVFAPAYYAVISNGVKVEENELGNGMKSTHWKEDIPLSTKVMVIGVAKFATKTFDDSPQGIPVSAWVYPQDSAKGFYDYGLAPQIVKFFSAYIAPFPYNKLANVQSKTIFGGMENSSAIFYAENSVKGDRSSEDLLAHEIAHQWFGDMVSEKSFAHIWLSEGFATWLTNYYLEKKYGNEILIKRLKQDRQDIVAFAKKSTHPIVDSTKDLMSLLNVNSYQKGGWVLHMLRNEVGDKIFQKILQTYYAQYKGGNAASADFATTAKSVSGIDMLSFFSQWLNQPGIPILKIQWKAQANKLLFTIHQKQTTVYRFPLELQLLAKDGRGKIIKISVLKKTEQVSIPINGAVSKIVIDPNTVLLFEEL